MIIENINLLENEKLLISNADIVWENNKIPIKNIFVATYKENWGFVLNPNSFLISCLIPAMYKGEKRIYIKEKICPELLENLNALQDIICVWYPDRFNYLNIQTDGIKEDTEILNTNKRVGLSFSGGVDSSFALLYNHKNYTENDSSRIKDCFFSHGLDIGWDSIRGERFNEYFTIYKNIKNITDDMGVNLIPVFCNFRKLCEKLDVWFDAWVGPILASVAHSFSGRITEYHISSSNLFKVDPPYYGTHPYIDNNLSDKLLKINHKYINFGRFEKINYIKDWDVVLKYMRVCNNVNEKFINCGMCEKCIRTKLDLYILDSLEKTKMFHNNKLDVDTIKKAYPWMNSSKLPSFYENHVFPHLKEKNHDDLIGALRERLKK